MDLRQQRRIGRLGGVGPQAGQHRVDVVAVGQLGELGADGQVDGVVAALVLEQLGARRDQPDRRGGRAPGRAEPDLALARQPGVRVDGSLAAVGSAKPRSRSSPATSAAWPPWPLALSTRILVSASLAGVTSVIVVRDTCSPSFWAGSSDRQPVAAGCTPPPLDVGRPVQGDHPDQQRHHRQGGEQQDCRQEVAATKRPTPLVERRAFCDLRDHDCTLRPRRWPLRAARTRV